MHPALFDEYVRIKMKDARSPHLATIERAPKFIISRHVHTFAAQVANHEALFKQEGDQAVFPGSSRLPAPLICLTVHGPKRTSSLLLFEKEDLSVDAFLISNGLVHGVGRWTPGSPKALIAHDAMDAGLSDISVAQWLWRTAFIISLINHPRKVARHEVLPSRQLRRQMERQHGITVAAYTEVCWEIGKAARAKAGGGDPKYRMPLHWCRAHYRDVGREYRDAVYMPERGGSGWYRWIRDSWKGHPDYGVKLQSHIPRVAGERRASPGISATTNLSAERLAAMDSAKAAALVQAGFAA